MIMERAEKITWNNRTIVLQWNERMLTYEIGWLEVENILQLVIVYGQLFFARELAHKIEFDSSSN